MGWYDGGHMGGYAPLMWIAMLAFWVGLIALIVFLVVRLFPSDKHSQTAPPASVPFGVQETPAQILDRMFALGQIDEETYRARRSALAEMRGAPTPAEQDQ